MDDQRTVLVRVTGRVQGVNFRVWTRDSAQRLGLAGWVRNERDGSVTASISGPASVVSVMLEQLWKGPALASVSSVEAKEISPPDGVSGFRITK
jgi:acylphosphatase